VDSGVLELLELNARRGDARAVLACFPGERSRALLHAWGQNAREIAERHRGSAWDAILLRVYETVPCHGCREFALETLVKRSAAPRRVLLEALWDGAADVRRVARAALRH
jgi:hypothetical protein